MEDRRERDGQAERQGATCRRTTSSGGNSKRRRIYLASRVGECFVDPEVFSAIGREVPPPLLDYIYILNILYGMGFHPRLDYIESGSRPKEASSLEELMVAVPLGPAQAWLRNPYSKIWSAKRPR